MMVGKVPADKPGVARPLPGLLSAHVSTIVTIEEHPSPVPYHFKYASDYLWVQFVHICSVEQLTTQVRFDAPAALVWSLEAVLDRERVMHTIGKLDHLLPILLIGKLALEDGVLDKLARLYNISRVRKVRSTPDIRQFMQFLGGVKSILPKARS